MHVQLIDINSFFLPREKKIYTQYIYTRFYKTHKNTEIYTTSQVIGHISWLINKNYRAQYTIMPEND